MKILHVLSQIQITGAETYALSLGRGQMEMGHEVLFVSDELHEKHAFRFFPLPIHRGNTSCLSRLKNVFSLRKILNQEDVGIVHSHSRAANLVVQLAAREFPSKSFPYVATVHGRWRNTFAFRRFPCLGNLTVAMCPYLKRYLIEDIGIASEKIVMIPNGVDPRRFSPVELPPERPTLLYVGRFTGQKGKVLKYLLKKVVGEILNLFPDACLKILGNAPSKEDLDLVDGLNGGVGFIKRAEIVPAPEKLEDLYRGATLVIGAGRVVLEAMAAGIPVMAIGESSAPGLLDAENFQEAFDSNFGDCGPWDQFLRQETRLIEDVRQVLSDPERRRRLSTWGRQQVLSQFSSSSVAAQIEEVYQKAGALA